ncbi:MAG: hypothetical protein MHMPM18_002681 [Marteilia pararefringens]
MIAISSQPEIIESYPYKPTDIKFFEFLTEDNKIIYGTANGTINVYNTSKKHACTLHRSTNTKLSALTIARPENIIAFCYESNYIVIGKYNKGEFKMNKLHGPLKSILSLDFSSNSKLLATGSADKSLKIYNTESLKFVGSFSGHKHWVTSVKCSPYDRDIVVSGSEDGTIKQWDIRCSSKIDEFILPTEGSLAGVADIGFFDSPYLLSVASNCTLKGTQTTQGNFQLFDLRNSQILQHYSEFGNKFMNFTKQLDQDSNDNKINGTKNNLVAILDSSSSIHVLDLYLGSCVYKIVPKYTTSIKYIKFSPHSTTTLFSANSTQNILFNSWKIPNTHDYICNDG